MSVVWHEVECGGYAADLPLWGELAERAGGQTLELGCGAGRVAIHLARRGHRVTGLDIDRNLVAVFTAQAHGLPASATVGDARDFDLDSCFDLAVAQMQLLQLFDGAQERHRCLRCVAAHLVVGGLAAFAIVEQLPEPVEGPPPLPDAREIDGWVYSSLPIDATLEPGLIRVRRLRQTVDPAGELNEELDEVRLRSLDAETLEAEAHEVGLRPAGRRVVSPTDAHAGSTVVLLERAA